MSYKNAICVTYLQNETFGSDNEKEELKTKKDEGHFWISGGVIAMSFTTKQNKQHNN